MMRSLWTAASGMKAQQMNVDSIANNIANVNTAGYKKEVMEFKSLFYETLTHATINENGIGRPVGVQMGHGVKVSANYKDFSRGSLEMTDNPLDFSIDGNGFFMVQDLNGEEMFTKQGSFKVALFGNRLRLTTTEGYAILGSNGRPVEFDANFNPSQLSVDAFGNLSYRQADDTVRNLNVTIGLVQFQNPAGLNSLGDTYYKPTSASGVAMREANNNNLIRSSLVQGTLESSNVQVVEEMVKMIVAQRAYELNSKSIQTSDDMLSLVNQLKR